MNLFSECLHKSLSKKSGIYAIVCNKHTYIGSSVNLYYRLKRHSSDLNNKKHANSFLQNVYNKYGKDSINFYIVEYCDTKVLLLKESFYIQNLKPNLNLDLNPSQRTFTEESLQKISKTLKDKYAKGFKNPFSKIVYRYSPDGDYLDCFESCTDAARKLNLSSKKISKAASGKGQSSGNYLWSYTKVDKLIKSINKSKKIIAKDINGNIVESWLSINDFSKTVNISHSAASIRIKKGNYYNGLKYEIYQVPG